MAKCSVWQRQYVEVKGRGRFPADGTRVGFHVEQVNGTRSWTQPANLHELLNDPDPKIFDPEHVVRASDSFDVDDFMRAIREGPRRLIGPAPRLVVVDTSVVSILHRKDKRAPYYERRLTGRRSFISFQTLEELWFGAHKNDWGARRQADLAKHLAQYEVVWAKR